MKTKLVVLTDSKKHGFTFCKVVVDLGFAFSEIAVGWIQLTEQRKKGDEIAANVGFESVEQADKEGRVFKRLVPVLG